MASPFTMTFLLTGKDASVITTRSAQWLCVSIWESVASIISVMKNKSLNKKLQYHLKYDMVLHKEYE